MTGVVTEESKCQGPNLRTGTVQCSGGVISNILYYSHAESKSELHQPIRPGWVWWWAGTCHPHLLHFESEQQLPEGQGEMKMVVKCPYFWFWANSSESALQTRLVFVTNTVVPATHEWKAGHLAVVMQPRSLAPPRPAVFARLAPPLSPPLRARRHSRSPPLLPAALYTPFPVLASSLVRVVGGSARRGHGGGGYPR